MSVHWGSNGMAELGEPSIAAAFRRGEANDPRPRFSPNALIGIVQTALAEEGVEFLVSPERLAVLLEAAATLLEAGYVRPAPRP